MAMHPIEGTLYWYQCDVCGTEGQWSTCHECEFRENVGSLLKTLKAIQDAKNKEEE